MTRDDGAGEKRLYNEEFLATLLEHQDAYMKTEQLINV